MRPENVIRLSIFITLLAIVLVAVKIYAPVPGYGGELPGEEKPVTVETMVKLYMYLTDPNPNIGEVKSSIISPSEFRTEDVGIAIFPWEGKLKVEVVSPKGDKITMYKNVVMDRGFYTERKFYFLWKTKQRGVHEIYVTLLNKEGNVVDSEKEEITI